MTYPTLCFQLQRCNAQRIMGRYENFVKIIRETFGACQYFRTFALSKGKKKRRPWSLGLKSKVLRA